MARGPDQHERYPSNPLWRVGAYVEFDVYAHDDADAWAVVTHLGIPEAQTKYPRHLPGLPMEGEINGRRVTGVADVMRVLSIHPSATPPVDVLVAGVGEGNDQ